LVVAMVVFILVGFGVAYLDAVDKIRPTSLRLHIINIDEFHSNYNEAQRFNNFKQEDTQLFSAQYIAKGKWFGVKLRYNLYIYLCSPDLSNWIYRVNVSKMFGNEDYALSNYWGEKVYEEGVECNIGNIKPTLGGPQALDILQTAYQQGAYDGYEYWPVSIKLIYDDHEHPYWQGYYWSTVDNRVPLTITLDALTGEVMDIRR